MIEQPNYGAFAALSLLSVMLLLCCSCGKSAVSNDVLDIAQQNVITKAGRYSISGSKWLTEVDIRQHDGELSVKVIVNENLNSTNRGATIRKEITRNFPVSRDWKIKLNEVARTIIFRHDSYELLYDFSDPLHSKLFESPVVPPET